MPTVYITVPPEAADEFAVMLVEERLAACVNQLESRSVYMWESKLVRERETVLLAKTTAGRYEALKRRVVDAHPYDVPCIERFDETDMFEPFADWIETSVGHGDEEAGL